jgi:hypothetical protein
LASLGSHPSGSTFWALQNPLIQNKNQIDFSSPLDHRRFAPGGYPSRAFFVFSHIADPIPSLAMLPARIGTSALL